MRLLYAIDLRVQDLWRMDDVARWASHLDATVDLIFVDPFGNYAPSVLDAELAQHLREGLERSRQADRELLETALAALPRASRGAILMEHGDPPTVICERADGYDALIVSTRGRHGPARMWLGSVAERIVRLHHGDTIVLHA